MASLLLLDTSALLTLRDDEPGAEQVEQALEQSERCYACFLTRMEVLYRVWKDENERAGRLAYEQLKALPLNWVEPLAEFNVALPRRDPADRNGSKRSGPPAWPPHRVW